MEGSFNVVCLCLLSFLSITGRFQLLTFYPSFTYFPNFIVFIFVVVLRQDFLY